MKRQRWELICDACGGVVEPGTGMTVDNSAIREVTCRVTAASGSNPVTARFRVAIVADCSDLDFCASCLGEAIERAIARPDDAEL